MPVSNITVRGGCNFSSSLRRHGLRLAEAEKVAYLVKDDGLSEPELFNGAWVLHFSVNVKRLDTSHSVECELQCLGNETWGVPKDDCV